MSEVNTTVLEQQNNPPLSPPINDKLRKFSLLAQRLGGNIELSSLNSPPVVTSVSGSIEGDTSGDGTKENRSDLNQTDNTEQSKGNNSLDNMQISEINESTSSANSKSSGKRKLESKDDSFTGRSPKVSGHNNTIVIEDSNPSGKHHFLPKIMTFVCTNQPSYYIT